MLKDKVVVITGASSGVGATIAKVLSKEGAILILTARSLEKLEIISSDIKCEHEIYHMDVTSSNEVYKVIEDVLVKYGRIDILINNAGFGLFDYFVDASISDYEEMIDTNYMGMIRCTKALLPSMLINKSGHIINIASVAGKIATAKAAGYSATKFAMIGFSNALRQELKNTGVYVSTINPGPIDTPFFEKADPSGNYVSNIKKFILSPDRVADEVLKVIENKKNDKTIPFLFNIGVKLNYIFPKIFDKMLTMFMNKK